MADPVAVRSALQSSLLLPRFRSRRFSLRSFVGFTGRPRLGSVNCRICAIESPQNRRFQVVPRSRAALGRNAPNLAINSVGEEDVVLQPDSSGEDGLGGGGGGGGGGGRGGGGGDNNEDSSRSSSEGGSDGIGSEGKKLGMSMSQKLTLGYAAVVGVGGVVGYIKGGSQKSLAAGGLSAVLLYYVYTQLPSNPALASSLGLGVSAALLGVMGSRFKNSGKVFPAGIVSAASLVMTAGYLHGILRSIR